MCYLPSLYVYESITIEEFRRASGVREASSLDELGIKLTPTQVKKPFHGPSRV